MQQRCCRCQGVVVSTPSLWAGCILLLLCLRLAAAADCRAAVAASCAEATNQADDDIVRALKHYTEDDDACHLLQNHVPRLGSSSSSSSGSSASGSPTSLPAAASLALRQQQKQQKRQPDDASLEFGQLRQLRNASKTHASLATMLAGSSIRQAPTSKTYAAELPPPLKEGHVVTSALPSHTVVNESGAPIGVTIWNTSKSWTTLRVNHPKGLVSNVNGGLVSWKFGVSYLNLRSLLAISFVAYPVSLVVVVATLSLLVGLCMQVKPGTMDAAVEASEDCSKIKDLDPCVTLKPKDLTESSQRVYACWSAFCRTLPCLFVFGMPGLLTWITYHYPQETFSCLSLLTYFWALQNVYHMAIFGCQGARYLMGAEATRSKCTQESQSTQSSETDLAAGVEAVLHWVIVPQYKEDFDVMAMTLGSIARNSMAAKNIGIVLAMEQREAAAPEKAQALKDAFRGKFAEIQASYHPANLPNDPPGKASNNAFAFCWLLNHLNIDANLDEDNPRRDLAREQASSDNPCERLGWEGRQPVVLTVADADSEFPPTYFEVLAESFLAAGPQKQDLRIWQSAIFHIKNYHNQPAPVKVGTIFTGVYELSNLADPTAVRFPYSTYSLSMGLARKVGGWDAEWIAEDWHMGLKCFFHTMGECAVEPLFVATCNYTPEDSTYCGTLYARWVQMKRHALGFSDFTYYFTMLPLVFCSALRAPRSSYQLQSFWRMAFYGTAVLFKLVNVHVMVGLLTAYGAMLIAMKLVLAVFLPEQRHVEHLLDATSHFGTTFTIVAAFSVAMVCFTFTCIYEILHRSVDGTKEESRTVHWMKLIGGFFLTGFFFFYSIGVCSWLAALNVLVSNSFKYEVALKPTTALGKSSESLPDGGGACPMPDNAGEKKRSMPESTGGSETSFAY